MKYIFRPHFIHRISAMNILILSIVQKLLTLDLILIFGTFQYKAAKGMEDMAWLNFDDITKPEEIG